MRLARHARTPHAVPAGALACLCLCLGLACTAPPILATTITIVNADPPDVGFNDPTPASPVGGNPGLTVGAQRRIAVQHAADVWASILESDVEIRVRALWERLTCDATSGFLGFAGPWGATSDFNGAEFPATWYPIALANKLAADDLDASNPDIHLRFNVELGAMDCLASLTWYYGLDNNAAPLEIDLVTTAMHEIAHGLGVLDYVQHSTGKLLDGQIDIYSRYIFDNTVGKHWPEMTDGERAISAINDGNVIWNGEAVSEQAANFLGNRPMFEVNAPPTVAGTYTIGTATFGPLPTIAGVTGQLVLVDDGVDVPTDACDPIVNGAELNGRVALIDRGSCRFTSKVKMAQDHGALAVVIVNHTAGAGVITMGGSDETITIPSVMISFEDGEALKAELTNGVDVTLDAHPTLLAGADDNGKVLLYAPDPDEPGSSILHWDDSATPNLLMEPNIPARIPQTGDLTVELFRDIGWFAPSVSVAITDMSVVSVTGAIVLSWRLSRETVLALAGVGVQRASSPEGPYVTRTPQWLPPAPSMTFEDVDVRQEESYWYRLVLVGRNGETEVARALHAVHSSGTMHTALLPPFETSDGEVEFQVRVGQASVPVQLEIYDVVGRRLRTLSLGLRDRGEHRASWDRRDMNERRVARGIYFVRMVAGTTVLTRKMALFR